MSEHLMDGWSGTRGKERSREKMKEVVRWLALFDFSNQEILAKAYGAEPRGQSAFFRRLEESRLVVVSKAPGLDWKFYSLSQTGMEMARVLLPHLELIKKRMPSWILLIHALSIQHAILSRRDELAAFTPEKDLKGARANHLPDAVLEYKDGRKIALEVELNRKSSARVYNIYLSHLKNINKELYDGVLYIFPNEQLRNQYISKYSEDIWPIYFENERGKLEQKVGENSVFYSKPVHDANLFAFTVEDMYSI